MPAIDLGQPKSRTRIVMHRSLCAAIAAACWLVLGLALALPAQAASAGAQALEDARQRLARKDTRGAVDVLEQALAGAKGEDRAAVLDGLRQAYEAAARRAEVEGRHAEAEAYRDNLEILGRKPRPAPPPPSPGAGLRETPSKPAPSDPAAEQAAVLPNRPALVQPATAAIAAEASAPLPPIGEPKRRSEPVPETATPTGPSNDQAIKAAPRPAPVSLPEAKPQPASGDVSVKSADAAFRAAQYDEAGKIYAALDKAKRLPIDRRDHWAYCRAVEVVWKINTHPQSAAEWAQIDAEIKKIAALSPTNWMAEYLRNLATERSREAQTRPQRSSRVIVRGASPEEKVSPAAPAPAPIRLADSQQAWNRHPIETANFQVYYVGTDRALAERVASAAEAARTVQVRRWGAVTPGGSWAPRCEVLLYSTAGEFSRDTSQPPDSPGFSRMGMNAGRIVHRRIHLRADHPTLVKAILPHEITHVVLADLFPRQQVPRWADEGMAVLAEPLAEQSTRAGDLEEPLKAGRLFRLNDLMQMDYPEPAHISLYYAQSVSLTRFLVETGSPTRFIQFVQEAQRSGFEPALQKVYEIAGYADLQSRWLTFAREHSSAATLATSSGDEPAKDTAATRR
jgi:hypothetical protein